MLVGEYTDNIPKVPEPIMDKIFQSISSRDYHLCGDNDFLRDIVHSATNSNPQAVAVMELLMPLILRNEDIELSDEEVDEDIFTYFCQELGVTSYPYYLPDRNIKGNSLILKHIEQYIQS